MGKMPHQFNKLLKENSPMRKLRLLSMKLPRSVKNKDIFGFGGI